MVAGLQSATLQGKQFCLGHGQLVQLILKRLALVSRLAQSCRRLLKGDDLVVQCKVGLGNLATLTCGILCRSHGNLGVLLLGSLQTAKEVFSLLGSVVDTFLSLAEGFLQLVEALRQRDDRTKQRSLRLVGKVEAGDQIAELLDAGGHSDVEPAELRLQLVSHRGNALLLGQEIVVVALKAFLQGLQAASTANHRGIQGHAIHAQGVDALTRLHQRGVKLDQLISGAAESLQDFTDTRVNRLGNRLELLTDGADEVALGQSSVKLLVVVGIDAVNCIAQDVSDTAVDGFGNHQGLHSRRLNRNLLLGSADDLATEQGLAHKLSSHVALLVEQVGVADHGEAKLLQGVLSRLNTGSNTHQSLEVTFTNLLEGLKARQNTGSKLVACRAEHRRQLLLNLLAGKTGKVDLADLDNEAVQPTFDGRQVLPQRAGRCLDGVTEAAEDQRELIGQGWVSRTQHRRALVGVRDTEELLALGNVRILLEVQAAREDAGKALVACRQAATLNGHLGAEQSLVDLVDNRDDLADGCQTDTDSATSQGHTAEGGLHARADTKARSSITVDITAQDQVGNTADTRLDVLQARQHRLGVAQLDLRVTCKQLQRAADGFALGVFVAQDRAGAFVGRGEGASGLAGSGQTDSRDGSGGSRDTPGAELAHEGHEDAGDFEGVARGLAGSGSSRSSSFATHSRSNLGANLPGLHGNALDGVGHFHGAESLLDLAEGLVAAGTLLEEGLRGCRDVAVVAKVLLRRNLLDLGRLSGQLSFPLRQLGKLFPCLRCGLIVTCRGSLSMRLCKSSLRLSSIFEVSLNKVNGVGLTGPCFGSLRNTVDQAGHGTAESLPTLSRVVVSHFVELSQSCVKSGSVTGVDSGGLKLSYLSRSLLHRSSVSSNPGIINLRAGAVEGSRAEAGLQSLQLSLNLGNLLSVRRHSRSGRSAESLRQSLSLDKVVAQLADGATRTLALCILLPEVIVGLLELAQCALGFYQPDSNPLSPLTLGQRTVGLKSLAQVGKALKLGLARGSLCSSNLGFVSLDELKFTIFRLLSERLALGVILCLVDKVSLTARIKQLPFVFLLSLHDFHRGVVGPVEGALDFSSSVNQRVFWRR